MIDFEKHTDRFDDGRGLCPDQIGVRAPKGFREQVRRAARAERITAAEFMRTAIADRVRAVLSREAPLHG